MLVQELVAILIIFEWLVKSFSQTWYIPSSIKPLRIASIHGEGDGLLNNSSSCCSVRNFGSFPF